MINDALSLSPRPFQFETDTYTFANELVWQYHTDPATGKVTSSVNPNPPTYTHRCFVMVRSVRQFYYHTRFDASLPRVGQEDYRALIRQVIARNPRRRGSEAERLVFPGYSCLREFSQANEPLLKAECGQPWESYFLRSHWRMVFPVMPWHAEKVAHRLRAAVLENLAPAVHLFRFPRITINHGIVLFALKETAEQFEFTAYDPNIPENPVKLFYLPAKREFHFPAAKYFSGGKVGVSYILCGGLY